MDISVVVPVYGCKAALRGALYKIMPVIGTDL